MKKIITFTIALAMGVSMFAQTVEASKPFENVSITVMGGAIAPLQTPDNTAFFQSVRGTAGVEVTKFVTPVFGFGVQALGAFNTTGANTWIDQSNIVANGHVNVSNIFGYKGQPRRVEVELIPGIGWGHNYGFDKAYTVTDENGVETTVDESVNLPWNDRNYLTYNAYGQVNFNLGKARAFQINVRPGITWATGSPNVGMYKDHAAASAFVGVTYKFGSRSKKSHNFVICPYSVTKADYDAALARIAELEGRKPETVEVEKVVEKEVVVEKTVTVTPMPTPYFEQNLAIVDATSVAALDALAQTMKETNDEYVLVGYASVEGNPEYNVKLAQKRADAIKKCLVDRGVDASRLTTVTNGATNQFGESYEVNRRVVVSKKD